VCLAAACSADSLQGAANKKSQTVARTAALLSILALVHIHVEPRFIRRINGTEVCLPTDGIIPSHRGQTFILDSRTIYGSNPDCVRFNQTTQKLAVSATQHMQKIWQHRQKLQQGTSAANTTIEQALGSSMYRICYYYYGSGGQGRGGTHHVC
jgi:hypothetical protein